MTDEIPSNEVVLTEPIAEKTVIAPDKFDGLSNREALKESIAYHREGKELPEKVAPSATEVKQAVNADIEPPSEFNDTGKAAWKAKDVAGIQKEYRRIHDSRTAEISRAQKAEREARAEVEKERSNSKPIKDMAERVKNYLSVRGEDNLADEVKIAQALQLVEEMRKGDSAAVKAELLKAGIDLDKPSTGSGSQVATPEIQALQKENKEIKDYIAKEVVRRDTALFARTFDQLTSQKTRAGECVFPDLLDNSEKGHNFAVELGSLVRDPGYQNLVSRRFPNADFTVLVRQAYIDLGGKVSGEATTVSTKSNQQHIDRSRRASAANPGRTAPRINESNLVGKLSNRAAMAKAIEIHRGE